MCSCYVASRNSADSKEDEISPTTTAIAAAAATTRNNKKITSTTLGNYRDNGGIFMDHVNKNIKNASNGLQVEPSSVPPLKSNLKKKESTVEMNHHRAGVLRNVSWSDAHGKDIAHVQEFEPSEEGELGGVGNSCRCAIQ